MQPNELQLVVKEAGLEENKVQSLLSSFGDSFSKAKGIAAKARDIKVTSEDQVEQMAEARKIRLELKTIRVNVENTRIKLKEQSLREGRAIDGISNVIKALIIPVEQYLEKQEKYAEEQKKIRDEEKFANRVELLTPYVADISAYNLREMSNETFGNLLESSKVAFNAAKAAEAKAEADRVAKEKADQLENERIRKENEALKKQAEEKERKIAEENRIRDEKLRVEREKQEAKLRAERQAKEALEAKIRKEKEDREARERAEEEKRRQALLAPDREKLIDLASTLDKLVYPAVASNQAGKLINYTQGKVAELSAFLREKAKSL